jgi:hypothetical protein
LVFTLGVCDGLCHAFISIRVRHDTPDQNGSPKGSVAPAKECPALPGQHNRTQELRRASVILIHASIGGSNERINIV